MKSLSAKLGVILLVMGLTICYAKVWGADWKEFAEATTGIFNYDAESISSPSKGFVRVWIHNVSKHETSLIEFNCEGRGYRVLDIIEYDEAGRIKNRSLYYDRSDWINIAPRSVPEPLHKIVCP